MRLLEFENADSVTNPQAAILTQQSSKTPAKKPATPRQRAGATGDHPRPIFPVSGSNAIKQAVRRNPVDLEQLQQRVEVLERRLRKRAGEDARRPSTKDMEQLKQRMKLVERSVHNELWAARQREHTMLEMLARPLLKTRIYNYAKHLHTHLLPATRRWCAAHGREWWVNKRPLWWRHLACAWQESLDKARGIPTP